MKLCMLQGSRLFSFYIQTHKKTDVGSFERRKVSQSELEYKNFALYFHICMQMTSRVEDEEEVRELNEKNVIPLKQHTYMNEFTSIFAGTIYPHNIEQTETHETLKY